MGILDLMKGGRNKDMPRFKSKIRKDLIYDEEPQVPEDDEEEEEVEVVEEIKKEPANSKSKHEENKTNNVKVIEREINLQLINDKLNYIIAKLEEFE